MPYIKKEQRDRLARGEKPQDAGELNYTLTTLLLDYLGRKGRSYAHFNEIMGVLSCVTEEFYRRWAVPYEDKKILENGDLDLPATLLK